jgi:Regulator of chromosome condensation (RCC1) repeat
MVGSGAGNAGVVAIGLLSALATLAACGSRGAALTDGATTDARGACSAASPPPGPFTSVAMGYGFACGIRGDGTVACWGDSTLPASAVPAGPFLKVALGACGCGLAPSGALVCWDCGGFPMAGMFQDVGVGEGAACARHDDGSIVCWAASYVPPPNTYLSLSMGAYYACAIEPAARAAVCWDPRAATGPAGQATTTQGPFQQVAAARFAACGIRMDATVACWGLGLVPDMETPPGGQFQEISMGDYHGCGLRADGSAVCWGRDTFGETIPPVGARFLHISAGVYDTCGVLVDGTIVCWGQIANPCGAG